MNVPPPPKLSGIALKMLAFYTEWHEIMSRHLTKDVRYSLGVRIDSLFTEVLEGIAVAQFCSYDQKPHYITHAITKNDTLKFMLYALHELQGIDEKKFISLSVKAAEIGRMLYGWKINAETKTAGSSTIANRR